MEINYLSKPLALISSALVILYCAVRIINKIWWTPKHLEKLLRRQGIRGTSYKLLSGGDMEEMRRSTVEAWSKPMSIMDHHIAPRALPFFHNMVQKYGKVCMSWTETRPRLIVADSEMVRLILLDKNGDFVKTPQNPLVDLLQQGISTLEGEKWANRRRLMTPAFHHDKLKGMMAAFAQSCWRLIERWKEVTNNSSVEGRRGEVDVAPELQILTSDAIARTAFGSNYEEGKRLFELQKEQAVLVVEAYQSIYFPGLRWKILWWATILYRQIYLFSGPYRVKRFVPTRKNRRRYKLDSEIKGILRKMIAKREQLMQINSDDVDLLGLLLLQCKGTDGGMTIDDVIEECKLFYIAGQETSASLLTWTMILLSMHPNWQQKAREEVLRLCGNKTPNFDVINHLKIVTMILNEVLRLYPPVCFLLRYTKQKTSVGGMSIPAGVETLLFILSLHNDAKSWGDDVAQFKPERFAEGVARSSNIKDNNYDNIQTPFYPFAWGPRICLGQSFAMIESKLALAMILQHFSFELSPSYTHAPSIGLTLQPQYGAPIILHRL